MVAVLNRLQEAGDIQDQRNKNKALDYGSPAFRIFNLPFHIFRKVG